MPTEQRGRVRTEPGAKRLRAFLGGQLVLDTTRPLLVWEIPYYPVYYVPAADLVAEVEATGKTEHSPSRGEAQVLTLRTADHEAVGAALRYPDSPIEALRDHVRVDWDAMDAWFEEDEEVFTHPRSPYARIDILPTSRRGRGPRRRRRAGPHDPGPRPVRDRAADPLVRAAGRRAHGPAASRPTP